MTKYSDSYSEDPYVDEALFDPPPLTDIEGGSGHGLCQTVLYCS